MEKNGLRQPKCYFTAYDAVREVFCLLMEDLDESGYAGGDQFSGGPGPGLPPDLQVKDRPCVDIRLAAPARVLRCGPNTTPLGRQAFIDAFTMWLAGGGIKGGVSYGQSDDFGMDVGENGVHIHDLNATILHLLGMDHKRLTYRYQGREFRLTDVEGNVVHDIIS